MEDRLFPFNLVHLSRDILSSLLLCGIPTYILISHGILFLLIKYFAADMFVLVISPSCGVSLSCRGNVSLAMLMFRMFTQFHNFMEVRMTRS